MQHTPVEVLAHVMVSPVDALLEKSVSSGDFRIKPSLNNIRELSVDSAGSHHRTNQNIGWNELTNIEHLTRGGSSLIYSARYNGIPVVVKTLRPKIRENSLAMSNIESELAILSRLNHANIVKLIGAGLVHSTGVRFLVFEKLDGGTLSQRLGFDAMEHNRMGRLWKKKRMSYHETLECARSLAVAMQYLHEKAIPNGMVLHRDLKPDNIAFSLDGTAKLLDFGLARILENGNPKSKEVYKMSGETGTLRYMAPEVTKGEPYNHKADVYSFGIILWEMLARKKSFTRLRSEGEYFRSVVHRGVRPPFLEEWPIALCALISDCWGPDLEKRPNFQQVIQRLDSLLSIEREKLVAKSDGFLRRIRGICRHDTKKQASRQDVTDKLDFETQF